MAEETNSTVSPATEEKNMTYYNEHAEKMKKKLEVMNVETGEGEGEPGAAEPGAEPGSGEGQKAVAKPVTSGEVGEEPMMIEPTNDGPLAPPVALPAVEPRIVSMPDPVIASKINGHKLKRDIKIFSAPSNYDEQPPAKVVDMCIIMDCTGSMSAWIKHCKDTLKEVIDDSMDEDEGSAVRVAFVGYRDFCDKSIYDVHDFTYLDGEMKKFISKRKAKGGGDAPEDVQGALHQALNLSWSENSIKLCFFVADAPCHGRQYHNSNDDYPNGNPNGLVLETLVKEFSDREILLTCYKLTNETEKMYGMMEKAYESGKEKDGFEFIDIRGQVQGHAALTHHAVRSSASSGGATRSGGFGGVASFFGEEEDDCPPPVSSMRAAPVAKGSRKRRDPSFSGVHDLFCDHEEEEEEAAPVMYSAPAPSRSRAKKVNMKSKEMGGLYSAATRENCRMQKKKMRKRKGW